MIRPYFVRASAFQYTIHTNKTRNKSKRIFTLPQCSLWVLLRVLVFSLLFVTQRHKGFHKAHKRKTHHLALPLFWVEIFAKPVADKIKGQHRQGNCDAGK